MQGFSVYPGSRPDSRRRTAGVPGVCAVGPNPLSDLAQAKGDDSRMKDPLQFPSQTDGSRTAPGPAPAEPQNVEAERALLGAILLDPDILAEVAKRLQPADFFLERHTLIYHCMTLLAQKGQRVDLVTLCAELDARGRLDF